MQLKETAQKHITLESARYLAYWLVFMGSGGMIGGILAKTVTSSFTHVLVTGLKVTADVFDTVRVIAINKEAYFNLKLYQVDCIGLIVLSFFILFAASAFLKITTNPDANSFKMCVGINLFTTLSIVVLCAFTFQKHHSISADLAKSFRNSFLGGYNFTSNSNSSKSNSNDIVDQFQRVWECCGAVDYTDYKKLFPGATDAIPASCCRTLRCNTKSPTSQDSYIDRGCYKAIYHRIEHGPLFLILSMVAELLFFVGFALFGCYVLHQRKEPTFEPMAE